MFKPSFNVTIPMVAFVSLIHVSAPFAETDCKPKSCDAECMAYYNAHHSEIQNKWLYSEAFQFNGVCSGIPMPKERRSCYVENLADEQGIKPSDVDNYLFKFYVGSADNPPVKRCVDVVTAQEKAAKAEAERNRKLAAEAASAVASATEAAPAPAPTPSKPKAKTQSNKAKLDKMSASNNASLEQQKAEVDKAAKDKETLLDQQSAANEAILKQQQEDQLRQQQGEEELRKRQMEVMNNQAETNFAVQGVGSNLLQQGFRSVLEGALNK